MTLGQDIKTFRFVFLLALRGWHGGREEKKKKSKKRQAYSVIKIEHAGDDVSVFQGEVALQ